ncbi:MAG: ABC transporter ATP-binding protein [Desulfuromonadales bacterium]|nr:ABC transporter ATP-binding protein [Desulfuromonadales bacterium]NIR33044.1 ABC transporter ATP-binding protein [Desulfuromonadales bacterium]NIS43063.1 ABC transporter ATP-binding protein [Desulfuromonadales bacterium]
MAFIDIQNLTKRYTSEADCVEALGHVSVSVEEGTFLGVMGPSGSGKSTLLAILGGLCRPTEGTVSVDEIDIFALSGERLADFRREYLGFIFQSHNLVPYLTALENVMLPLAVKKMPGRDKKKMAVSALERVGLSHRCSHLPNQLSGGEQERVAIARAIVNRPPLLLADEPTGSLDTATSEEIMALLRELNDDGQTVVMVTHNPENCRYFNNTLLLRDGRVEALRESTSGGLGKAV